MKTLGIIPARGGSKRVPKKNIRNLCGKPLIAWTIEFAQSIKWFDRIHVSTDCNDIAAVSERQGLEVPFFRDPSTASDTATTVDVVREVIEKFQSLGETYDLVAVLQPTTPWRKQLRWAEARNAIIEQGVDSVVGSARASEHPYQMFITSPNGSVQYLFPQSTRELRSQELPPSYYINGSLYLTKVPTFLSENSLSGGLCVPVVCSEPYENIDIDTEADLHDSQSLRPEDWSL
jgi:CMP-N-acetylneuraminic acid synthetase